MFSDFVKAFTTGFIALKAAAENVTSMVKILSVDSPFPCFAGKDTAMIDIILNRNDFHKSILTRR